MHYWAVRQYDLRSLQRRLATFGLSSLGRSEPHVQASLDAIVAAATSSIGHTHDKCDAIKPVISFTEGARLLRQRTAELLGPEPDRGRPESW